MTVTPRSRGAVLRPSPRRDQLTGALGEFLDWLAERQNFHFNDYGELWRWSTNELESFWAAVWDYYEVGNGRPQTVLTERVMPGADWFPDANLNYAEEVLRRAPRGDALIFMKEDEPPRAIAYDELRARVGALGTTLRNLGVGPGDRVAGFLPNVPEAIVALLATASLGAVWTACAPDFGAQSVLDRFVQVDPVVLIATDGYRFNGRPYDRRSVVERLQQGLPS